MRKTSIAGDFVPSTPRIYRFRLMNRQENEKAGHFQSCLFTSPERRSGRFPALPYPPNQAYKA